jgi:hypothetical protein
LAGTERRRVRGWARWLVQFCWQPWDGLLAMMSRNLRFPRLQYPQQRRRLQKRQESLWQLATVLVLRTYLCLLLQQQHLPPPSQRLPELHPRRRTARLLQRLRHQSRHQWQAKRSLFAHLAR